MTSLMNQGSNVSYNETAQHDQLYLTAIHEAAHAVLGLHFSDAYIGSRNVTINDDGSGFTDLRLRQSVFPLLPRHQFRMTYFLAVSSMAGHMSEHIYDPSLPRWRYEDTRTEVAEFRDSEIDDLMKVAKYIDSLTNDDPFTGDRLLEKFEVACRQNIEAYWQHICAVAIALENQRELNQTQVLSICNHVTPDFEEQRILLIPDVDAERAADIDYDSGRPIPQSWIERHIKHQ